MPKDKDERELKFRGKSDVQVVRGPRNGAWGCRWAVMQCHSVLFLSESSTRTFNVGLCHSLSVGHATRTNLSFL